MNSFDFSEVMGLQKKYNFLLDTFVSRICFSSFPTILDTWGDIYSARSPSTPRPRE